MRFTPIIIIMIMMRRLIQRIDYDPLKTIRGSYLKQNRHEDEQKIET